MSQDRNPQGSPHGRPYLSRRTLLAAGVGLAATARAVPALAQVPAPAIAPRSSWGADLPPRGPLEAELPDDVRFLLVHHTASGNNYGPGDAIGQLQSFYRFHTGPEKGWPDIAYNFLIDRFGVIYEGRQGSIDAPIKASATGGSQGFAVLACFIGDLEAEAPTDAAQESMVQLLTWLAARYAIDPMGQTTFESRGSNLHPAGTVVTTGTIAGHRDMSQTTCPGQFGYQFVGALPDLIAARTSASAGTPAPVAPPPVAPPPVAPPAPVSPPPAPLPTAPAATEPLAPAPLPTLPPSSDQQVADAPAPIETVTPRPALVAVAKPVTPGAMGTPGVIAAGLLGAVGAGLVAVIRRRGLR